MNKAGRVLNIIPNGKWLPNIPLTINTKTDEPLKIEVYSPVGIVIRSIVSSKIPLVPVAKLAKCPSGHTSAACSLASNQLVHDTRRLCQDCWLQKCVSEFKVDLCGYCYKNLKALNGPSAGALEWNPMRYHSKCWDTIVELTRH